MKIKILLILSILCALAYNADAQVKGVLIDIETRQPIDGAAIYTNTNKKIFSDKNGHFFISDPNCTSITLTHNSYVRRNMEVSVFIRKEFFIGICIDSNSVNRLSRLHVNKYAPYLGISIINQSTQEKQYKRHLYFHNQSSNLAQS
jgi:hypothetical protein